MEKKTLVNDKKRERTRIAVYLMGMRGDAVLLAKRQNTGHMDGHWSLVAGHVYEGESATQALLREVKEECGIDLSPDAIKLIGAMHHYSHPYDYVNFIFSADLTHHEPINKEEHKCEMLAFHSVHELPDPLVHYVQEMIKQNMNAQNFWICEFGWDYKD